MVQPLPIHLEMMKWKDETFSKYLLIWKGAIKRYIYIFNNHFILFPFLISIHIYFHLQASSILMLNRLNFSDWCEQVQFYLGVLHLDLVIKVKKPTTIIDKRSDKEKNYLCNLRKIEQIRLNVYANDKTKPH